MLMTVPWWSGIFCSQQGVCSSCGARRRVENEILSTQSRHDEELLTACSTVFSVFPISALDVVTSGMRQAALSTAPPIHQLAHNIDQYQALADLSVLEKETNKRKLILHCNEWTLLRVNRTVHFVDSYFLCLLKQYIHVLWALIHQFEIVHHWMSFLQPRNKAITRKPKHRPYWPILNSCRCISTKFWSNTNILQLYLHCDG